MKCMNYFRFQIYQYKFNMQLNMIMNIWELRILGKRKRKKNYGIINGKMIFCKQVELSQCFKIGQKGFVEVNEKIRTKGKRLSYMIVEIVIIIIIISGLIKQYERKFQTS